MTTDPRPAQEGLYAHFATLADATARPILIYNVPYRASVNMHNETMLGLAEHDNIVGVKDCCADPAQSLDLLRHRRPGFAVLTGEDASFHGALVRGADGGILACAHVDPRAFAAVRDRLVTGDQLARYGRGMRGWTCRGCCSRNRARRRSSIVCGVWG